MTQEQRMKAVVPLAASMVFLGVIVTHFFGIFAAVTCLTVYMLLLFVAIQLWDKKSQSNNA